MKSVIPYLSFDPRTEAALMFYTEALGGKVTTLQPVPRWTTSPVGRAADG